MRTVVTGAAGFVGSHLCTHLLEQGDDVVGIDAMTDFYDVALKERNLAALTAWDSFSLHRLDLLDAPLRHLLDGAEVVFHLAGQPGVRPSWGSEFAIYAQRNIMATQRLLETLRDVPVRKIVFASSSSVYGDAESYPCRAPVRAVPGELRHADRVAAPVHRVRPSPAARYGLLAVNRRRTARGFLPAVRRWPADPGLHLCQRRGNGDAGGRPVRLDRCRQHRWRIADLAG